MIAITALVPIRQYSERIKDKNLRLFNGKPLYHWIINVLDRSKYIEKIIINTDSSIIIEQAEKLSHKIILKKRKQELCSKNISMNMIIQDDIKDFKSDFYLQTHATNPLIKTTTIDKAIEFIINNKKYDSLFAAKPIQKFVWNVKKQPINHDPYNLKNTQDLEPVFEENSNIYIFSEKSFQYKNSRIGRKPYMFVMDPQESSDIDKEIDFEFWQYIKQNND